MLKKPLNIFLKKTIMKDCTKKHLLIYILIYIYIKSYDPSFLKKKHVMDSIKKIL